MAKERTNRLSPEGRLRCSASGVRNIRLALETRRADSHSLKAATAEFEAALAREVGEVLTAGQQALVLSAVASFTALFLIRAKLRAATRFRRIETLVAQLTPLQGALQRTLRALGLAGGVTEDDAAPGPTLAEYLKQKEAQPNEHPANDG